MDETAIFDLPTWGGPFNPHNVTQTHSIFVKLLKNTFLGMPKVRVLSIFTLPIPYVGKNVANSKSCAILRLL